MKSNTMLHTRFIAGLFAFAFATANFQIVVLAKTPTDWEPARTRVFIVSLTRFQSERLHSFSSDDRLDNRFAQTFLDRGVPQDQMVYLKDEVATAHNIKTEFTKLLDSSRSGETLFFYFGSHGSFNAQTNSYSFCAFDENVSFHWFINEIERGFHGNQAIITTDCCFSGGIVELVNNRKTSISYACLSSTYSHQIARSGWRFLQCLLRGMTGNPVVDLNDDEQIDIDELALYTTRYMAFVADGKPMFLIKGNLSPKLRIAKTAGRKGPRVGDFLEVHRKGSWEKAEILEANLQELKVHFTKDTTTKHDSWITSDLTRSYEFEKFPIGSIVDFQNTSDGDWYPAKVLERWESLHLCLKTQTTSTRDEWIGPNHIRRSVAGSWSGIWQNSLDEFGREQLEISTSHDGRIDGTWSGNLTIKGERIGRNAFFFEAKNANRTYRCSGRLKETQLCLDYVAHRSQERGHYFGRANLKRHGEVEPIIPEDRAEVSGTWTGSYENSRGASGIETLVLSQNGDELHGNWSGVMVSGERLGNRVFYLGGHLDKRVYQIIAEWDQERLMLNYSAKSSKDHYVGQSILVRQTTK